MSFLSSVAVLFESGEFFVCFGSDTKTYLVPRAVFENLPQRGKSRLCVLSQYVISSALADALNLP